MYDSQSEIGNGQFTFRLSQQLTFNSNMLPTGKEKVVLKLSPIDNEKPPLYVTGRFGKHSVIN